METSHKKLYSFNVQVNFMRKKHSLMVNKYPIKWKKYTKFHGAETFL